MAPAAPLLEARSLTRHYVVSRGVFRPKGPEIFDSNGETTAIPLPLWRWFTAMALVLYIVDVLLRRLRLFET